MNKIWLCTDVLMDIFPFFGHAQLGLKLALISPRFDVLVDKHFDGKSEFTIWRAIIIHKDIFAKVPKLHVLIGANSVEFPLPDHSLPNKIRFKNLRIEYIDHSVIAFLRSNQQIWDKKGTNLHLPDLPCFRDDQPIWDVFSREIWPIFAPNIRRLGFTNADHFDNLRRLISPTILTDCNQLNSISIEFLYHGMIGNDDPNGTAGHALSKWLNTPRKDGRPKQFRFSHYLPRSIEWINIFKEQFIRATTSASCEINFFVSVSMPIVPFELMNGRTNEKLTLIKASENKWACSRWVIKRCLIGETASAVHWQDENLNHLNTVCFELGDVKRCFGPLSPPAGQSSKKGV